MNQPFLDLERHFSNGDFSDYIPQLVKTYRMRFFMTCLYYTLDIQGHLLRFGIWIPNGHTIQTPNLRRYDRLDVFRDTCRENRDVLLPTQELKKLAVELTEQLDQVGMMMMMMMMTMMMMMMMMISDDEYKYEYEFNDLLHHAVSHNHLTTTKTTSSQEYTALMASIEEIQALMEAEVAGGSFWFLNEVTD